MRIESSNYLSALEALRNANTATTQSTTTSTQTKEMDAYIPSNSEDEILYANYNDILSSYLQAMQSSSSTTESTSSTSATQAVDSTIKSIVDNISNSLRCNKETVFSTLQNLGLTPEDLLDSDNIATLATALNEGAEALGLPTVEDLDQTISDLQSSVESSVSTLKSDYSLSDEDLASLLEALKSSRTDHTETTESDSTKATKDAIQSLISDISDSLRCNEDSVLSTLESLGLTPEDLLDSDNIETLANALNEGAQKLGLPTVDDWDQIVSDLKEASENASTSLKNEYSLTDEELASLLEELKSKPLEDYDLSSILSSLTASSQTEA